MRGWLVSGRSGSATACGRREVPYARFDDRWDDHKKIRRALGREPIAALMHAMAIVCCNRHNTDGVVDSEWIDEKFTKMKLKPAQRRAVLGVMLDPESALFERVDGTETYIVHDYLDWNMSSAQRRSLANQGRKGGLAKAAGQSQSDDTGQSHGSSHGYSDGYSRGQSDGSSTPTPTPTPLHSTPTPRKDKDVVEPDRLDEISPRYVAMSVHFFEQIRARDAHAKGDPHSKAWLDAARLLVERDGRSFEEIAAVMRWLPTDDFWPSVVLSMPKFREKFTALVAKMNRPAPAASSNGHSKESSPSGMLNRLLRLPETIEGTVVDATVTEEA